MEQLRAAVHRDFRRILIGLALLLVVVIAGGWFDSYQSCQRTEPWRSNAQHKATLQYREATFWDQHGHPGLARIIRAKAGRDRALRPLGCVAVVPPTH